MQKFTRPLTREIEVNGQRLAITFSEKGLSVRPVGSRKPPREMTWPALITALDQQPAAPTEEKSAAKDAEEDEPAPAPKGKHGSVPALLERLEKWLAAHRKKFLDKMPHGATGADLKALETALGKPVPDDLKALLSWRNGQAGEGPHRFWERWYLLGTKQIAEFHSQMLREEKDRWKPEWVPFLNDDNDNSVFLDEDEKVCEFWQKSGARPPSAPSLEAWLKEFVEGLEAGKFTEDPDRGHFLRSAD